MTATEYLKLWKQHKTWERLAVSVHQQRLKRCASLVRGSTFIDVGCAFGHSTYYLSKFREGIWTGMDFDESTINEARSLFPQCEFFYSPNYDMLKATDGRKFDSVVCSEVIEHVEEDRKFIEELLRLATIRIVLTTPSKPIASKGHLRCYTQESLALLLSSTKFSIKRGGRFFYATIDI